MFDFFAADFFFVIVDDDVEFFLAVVLPEAVEDVDLDADAAANVDAEPDADDAIDFHFFTRAFAFGPKILS